jgi:hypothetical protein
VVSQQDHWHDQSVGEGARALGYNRLWSGFDRGQFIFKKKLCHKLRDHLCIGINPVGYHKIFAKIIMKEKTKVEPKSGDYIAYLDIAAKFRTHEFNIQVLRNVAFSGGQAILLACYAATISNFQFFSLLISAFGILLSILWFFYYRGSMYWAWYWELRCREITDEVIKKINFDLNLFHDHPIGTDKEPAPLFFAGKKIKW